MPRGCLTLSGSPSSFVGMETGFLLGAVKPERCERFGPGVVMKLWAVLANTACLALSGCAEEPVVDDPANAPQLGQWGVDYHISAVSLGGSQVSRRSSGYTRAFRKLDLNPGSSRNGCGEPDMTGGTAIARYTSASLPGTCTIKTAKRNGYTIRGTGECDGGGTFQYRGKDGPGFFNVKVYAYVKKLDDDGSTDSCTVTINIEGRREGECVPQKSGTFSSFGEL